MTAVEPAVCRIPLYGAPCGECGLPAAGMAVTGTRCRVWHADDDLFPCDFGHPLSLRSISTTDGEPR